MRCLACNRILTEAEDAQTFAGSGERVSLCGKCTVWIPSTVPVVTSLNTVSEVDSEVSPEVEDEWTDRMDDRAYASDVGGDESES